jgi:ribonuclease HI
MEITIYTDGGSINNPGKAAAAYLIYQDKTLVAKQAVCLGIASNNVAEYTALVLALTKIKKISWQKKSAKIVCFSDSSLMVNQLNGLFKVKNKNIRDLLIKIRILEQEINLPIVYNYISREKNRPADWLVKKALQADD